MMAGISATHGAGAVVARAETGPGVFSGYPFLAVSLYTRTSPL